MHRHEWMTGNSQLGVLALARSSELKDALTAALGDRHGATVEVQIGELKTANGALLEKIGKADIVLLDLDASDEQELAVLKRIVEEHRDGTAILATTREITATTMRQLVRHGVDDFIPQPVTPQDVLDALDVGVRKLRLIRGSGRSPGKVVGFMRAKGGMGATTLALHTALTFQRDRGRRARPKQACVLDLDLQFGDAACCFGLDAKQEALEIIRTPQRLNGALLRGAMIQHKSGLFVLPAPVPLVSLEALSAETALQLVELAREEFDYVVLDLPPTLAGWVEPVLRCMDRLMIVTQLNVPAIRQTRRLLDMLHDEGLLSVPASLVLNRQAWRLTKGRQLKQIAKVLGQPIDYFIPNNAALVLSAANRGLPIFDLRRWSRVGRAIAAMAADCAARLENLEAQAA